LVKVFKGY